MEEPREGDVVASLHREVDDLRRDLRGFEEYRRRVADLGWDVLGQALGTIIGGSALALGALVLGLWDVPVWLRILGGIALLCALAGLGLIPVVLRAQRAALSEALAHRYERTIATLEAEAAAVEHDGRRASADA
jgi:hypothetical protein